MLKKIRDKKRKWKFFLFFKANFSPDFSPLSLIFTVFLPARVPIIRVARKTAAIERSESGNESGKAGELSI